MNDVVVDIASRGHPRGSIVRLLDSPNMLVVRSRMGADQSRTAVVVCENDNDGSLRLRDYATADLEQVLPDAGQQDQEFDIRWSADMRAIKAWQEETGEILVWPDHVDLVVWLLRKIDEAGVRLPGDAP